MTSRRFHIKHIDVCIVVALFVFSFLIRLPLVKENALGFFSDETRYNNYLTDAFDTSVIEEDFHRFWKSVFDIHARPAYGVLYLPSLYFTNITHNNLFGPIYNLVLNSFCIVLLFFIVKKAFSYKAALLSTGLFLFSMTSVSYVRHMLPYDGALLFYLLGLCIYVYSRAWFFFGVCMGMSFAVYPGNYFYIVPIPFLLLFCSPGTSWSMKLRRFVTFAAGLAVVLVAFEYLSVFLEKPMSYIQTAIRLSRTVIQGDFIPALKFIVQYVYANDGFFGISIVAAAILSLFFLQRSQGNNRYRAMVSFYMIGVYLIMEIMSFGTHSMVLYGRTVRILYLCMMVSVSVWLAERLRYGFLVMFVLLVLAVHWILRYSAYVAVVYPNDFLSRVSSLYVSSAPLNVISSGKEQTDDDDRLVFRNINQFYITNIGFLYPYYGVKKIDCKDKIVLLHAPYPLAAYTPYLFEGFSEAERRSFFRDPPQYQFLYCR